MDSATPPPPHPIPAPLSALEARVLGCLIEKELTTPDVYPLTLNALVNACNQKSNRDPVMEVTAREVEAALEELRLKHLAILFSGADARVPKFKQKLDAVYPMATAARALLGELLLRGPQTLAGLRANAERMAAMPPTEAFEAMVNADLVQRPSGALVRQLPRQPGQKEARWAQLLTGEPAPAELRREAPRGSATGEEPVKVTVALPTQVEQRLAALEAEVVHLRAELARLKQSLGE
jgi:uncharacterized protein YceH (UPF0502 family)